MEETECSETSAYKIQMPGNYPEENTTYRTRRKFEIKKVEFFPLNLDNGRSPHVYINHRLQIRFRAPDDEGYAARNMLFLQ